MIGYIGDVKEAYSQPHRKWHTMQHIYDMFAYCGDDMSDELFQAILWHDYVYVPGAKDNEEKSAEAWMEWSSPECNSGYEDIDRERVEYLILATKNPFEELHKIRDLDNESPDEDLYKLLTADLNIFFINDKKKLIEYEDAIFYEFQKFPVAEYREGRIKILNWIQSQYAIAEPEYDACSFLIDYVESKTYKVGIYAGSFNPYHIGHEDVVLQAEKNFDKVILAQGYNREKEKPPVMEGSFREIIYYDSLLIDLFNEEDGVEKTLIRGLRNSFDVGYEDILRNTLLDFKEISIVYYFCKKEHEHISSSMIRGLMPFGEETYNRYLP